MQRCIFSEQKLLAKLTKLIYEMTYLYTLRIIKQSIAQPFYES